MADRILEGLWDCPYCGTKAIGGLTKHCPNCGHPQDEGTKFYMGTAKRYLEDEIAAQYGKGADWICDYCGSMNRVHFEYCSNCGSPKDMAERDYFNRKKPEEESEQTPPPNKKKEKAKKRGGCVKYFLLAFLVLFVSMVVYFLPRTSDATVTDKSWDRAVDIEEYKTVQESDWSVPSGGRTYKEKSEIHHYEDVFDHYETRTREVAQQVYDGQDTHTEYSDNGDGTFTEHTYTTPRYRTEYHTETYQEAIYRQEPVYYTKYYYEIERWVFSRTESSGGGDEEPYWPSYSLKDNERESEFRENYSLVITTQKGKAYTVELPEEFWSSLKLNEGVSITVSGYKITVINDQRLE